MGRRRQTEAEHRLKGTFEKHPEREAAYKKAPKPKGPLGDPPEEFTVEGGCSAFTSERLIKIWKQIVAECPPGVLTISDRLWTELTCRAIHRIRTNQAKGSDWGTAERFLSKMAMNPSDRPNTEIGGGAAPATGNGTEEENGNVFEGIAQEVRSRTRPN